MYTSEDDGLFLSKINDAVSLCLTKQKPIFTRFLSERKQALAQKRLAENNFTSYAFWGGFENSERKVLGLFYNDADIESFPICAVEFRYRSCDELTHRDFLGTLMSLGIERDTVGDILVGQGRCVTFLRSEMKAYVEADISKIGRVGVKLFEPDLSNLPQGRGTEEISLTVSSLRLDNTVSAICGLSREKAKGLIASDSVSLNYFAEQNVSRALKQGDVLIIKGKGKFILNSISGVTKKGRLKISVIHFR